MEEQKNTYENVTLEPDVGFEMCIRDRMEPVKASWNGCHSFLP